RHPSTRSLLDATPSLHRKGERLSQLPPLAFAQRPEVDRERVVVSVRGVSQSFRRPDGTRLQAVDDISSDLRAGETVGIVGESGSGKTTLGRIILGLQQPESGEVRLDGRPWSGVPERHRRRRRHTLQAVYQDPLSSFDPRSSVGAILREALALTGVAKAHRQERAAELAAQVGLAGELLQRNPLALS